MSKAYFTPMPSVLCKIFGVYKVGSHNKDSDRKITENVVVMENIFYQVWYVLNKFLLSFYIITLIYINFNHIYFYFILFFVYHRKYIYMYLITVCVCMF